MLSDNSFLCIFIIFSPLVGCLLAGFLGRFIGTKGAMLLTTMLMICNSVFSLLVFWNVALSAKTIYVKLACWINSDLFIVNWGFMFDSLTIIMLIVVNVVSTLVHIYSCSYMGEDPHAPRFMAYLSFFTFFMLMLISGDNFIQLFFGWEGVGLCSYLLISFWYTRVQANKSAIKALVMNRVGDFGLLFGILISFYVFKTIEFSSIFALAPFFINKYFIFLTFKLQILPTICFLLFIGSMGKSAQVGLHTWLPDAMEGPTPVSALIHAATMVTAGVFLVIRCSPLFEFAPNILTMITFIGAITAFFAATTGLVQNDIKKVIAYSTCSQLGYMIFACGLSGYNISLFHLFNHAFFKALLFLSAGSVIHSLSNEQDLRRMGGLTQIMPLTYIMFCIGSLALMGYPFMAGFYSKDVILELAFAKYQISGTFAHWLGAISASFTAYYSFRLIYFTFLEKTNSYKSYMQKAHELPILMAIPLFILSFGSIFIGYLLKDVFIGLGTPFFNNSIYISSINLSKAINAEFIPTIIKVFPIILSFIGADLALNLNKLWNNTLTFFQTNSLKNIYEFLINKWHFDTVYNYFIGKNALNFGYLISFKLIDKGLLESLGPKGSNFAIYKLLSLFEKVQSGYIYCQANLMLWFLIYALLVLDIFISFY